MSEKDAALSGMVICVRSSPVSACESRQKTHGWARGEGYAVEHFGCLRCGHLVARPVWEQILTQSDPEKIMRKALLRISEWPPGANELWAKKICGDALSEIMDIRDPPAPV